MHPEAYAFVARAVAALPFAVSEARVVECGSYIVNGSIRPIFDGCAHYVGFDRRAGPGVDVVSEAAGFGLGVFQEEMYDVFVSCGSIEHAARPADITECAARCLRPGGVLILHGEQQRPHGNDGGGVLPGEVYTDFTPDAARQLLAEGWEVLSVDTWASDVYVVARRVATFTTAGPAKLLVGEGEADAVPEPARIESDWDLDVALPVYEYNQQTEPTSE